METPRRKIRTSTQAPTLSQVRQNCLRNQIFSPADSGLGSSPATGTLHDVHTETMPDIRRIGHCSPSNNQDRAVQEMSNTEKDGGNGWKKFWQICVSLLTLSICLVASAWIYFPNNTVVQKSQEYVMIGLLAIICLIISTIVLKFVWNFVISGYKTENTVYTWSRNRRSPNHMYNGLSLTPDNVITETSTSYYSDEMPSYSSPRPNRPVINGQRQMELELPGQTSENMGLSLGHVQLPESDSLENECNDINGTTTEYPNTWCIRGRNVPSSNEYPVRRTFSGARNDVWNEFIQYFENISELNLWNNEKSRSVLLSTLRGQAETYAYGMPVIIQRDNNRLKQKMEERFGHTAMKERAYPGNPEIVEENSIKAFLDECGQSEDFRLAVKRTRPNTLQEAVINSMQEECLRVGEKDLAKHFKPVQRPIFEVEDGDSDEDVTAEAEGTQRENIDRNKVPDNYPRNSGKGSQGRFYNRDIWRGRDRSPMFKNRPPEFPEPTRGP
ncbi:unnamed protein product [Mytilus coruscus]|uniref:Uncharacterized protein n=1 Tax=Mytilus coruscus TaxID=42192 RepID=A0A6J8D849_MYTCO|nr:unnamed protein product [Mytilus coruscus]